MKKTHEEYIKELSIINPKIEVIGKYTRAVDHIEVQCKDCGLRWNPQAYRLLQGIGCPECGKRKSVENRKGKTAKKTTKQFIQELNSVNTTITINGEYTGNKSRINCSCNVCGYNWNALPYLLLKGSSCPNCTKIKMANNKRYTPDSFKEKLFQVNPDIELLSNYTKSSDCINVRCKKCGNAWSPKAYSLLQGKGCRKCSYAFSVQNNKGKTGLKSLETFKKELAQIDSSIEVIGEYVNTHIDVNCKCSRCNHVWAAKPYALLQGHGCPRCAKSGTSFMEQLILLSFREAIGSESVLSRDKTIIGMELDVVIPEYKLAIEPGNWFLHMRSLKRDEEKRNRCKEAGFQLVTIYDQYPNDKEPPFIDNCYVYNIDLNRSDHSLIHDLIYGLFSKCEINRFFSSEEWSSLEEQAYRNSKSLTHEDFVERLFAIRPDIEVLGNYENANRRIEVKCKRCGFCWEGIPANLLSGDGCRKCGAQIRGEKATKKQEEFEKELKGVNSTVKVIGAYIGRHKPIIVQCLKCGTEWETTPGSLLRKEYATSDNNGCPICSKSKMGTPKKKVMNLDTGEIFDSAIQAGEKYNIVPSAIRQCCRGRSKSSNGFHWKYIDKEHIEKEQSGDGSLIDC